MFYTKIIYASYNSTWEISNKKLRLMKILLRANFYHPSVNQDLLDERKMSSRSFSIFQIKSGNDRSHFVYISVFDQGTSLII